MPDPPTNLQVVRRSRHHPKRGDVFVMQLPSQDYLFGRVILAEPPRERAPTPSSYLIYVYDRRSREKKILPADLKPDQLLIPPVWINRMPWSKGYFQTIENTEIGADDVLVQHCFRVWNGDFLDETGGKLAARVEPCGEWALFSYRWLDDQVSDALGIARVPET
jgi:hypothetical protein